MFYHQVMEYEYEPSLEPSYRNSFLKNFKRQIDECYFSFIIVDAIFDKVAYLDEFWSYSKSKGFQVSWSWSLVASFCIPLISVIYEVWFQNSCLEIHLVYDAIKKQVYVAEVQADIALCVKRNTHQRKQAEIQTVCGNLEFSINISLFVEK